MDNVTPLNIEKDSKISENKTLGRKIKFCVLLKGIDDAPVEIYIFLPTAEKFR